MKIIALIGFFLPSLTLLGFLLGKKKFLLVIPPLILSICYVIFNLDLDLYKSEEGNEIHTIYFAFFLNVLFSSIENKTLKLSCLVVVCITNLLLILMGISSIKYLT